MTAPKGFRRRRLNGPTSTTSPSPPWSPPPPPPSSSSSSSWSAAVVAAAAPLPVAAPLPAPARRPPRRVPPAIAQGRPREGDGRRAAGRWPRRRPRRGGGGTEGPPRPLPPLPSHCLTPRAARTRVPDPAAARPAGPAHPHPTPRLPAPPPRPERCRAPPTPTPAPAPTAPSALLKVALRGRDGGGAEGNDIKKVLENRWGVFSLKKNCRTTKCPLKAPPVVHRAVHRHPEVSRTRAARASGAGKAPSEAGAARGARAPPPPLPGPRADAPRPRRRLIPDPDRQIPAQNRAAGATPPDHPKGTGSPGGAAPRTDAPPPPRPLGSYSQTPKSSAHGAAGGDALRRGPREPAARAEGETAAPFVRAAGRAAAAPKKATSTKRLSDLSSCRLSSERERSALRTRLCARVGAPPPARTPQARCARCAEIPSLEQRGRAIRLSFSIGLGSRRRIVYYSPRSQHELYEGSATAVTRHSLTSASSFISPTRASDFSSSVVKMSTSFLCLRSPERDVKPPKGCKSEQTFLKESTWLLQELDIFSRQGFRCRRKTTFRKYCKVILLRLNKL